MNNAGRTKGDDIRSMTNEELAHWIFSVQCRLLSLNTMLERPTTEAGWLQWLNERSK